MISCISNSLDFAVKGPETTILAFHSLNGEQYYVRFEVLTAVTAKNVVFWDIETHFVLHRRHITSPLQSPAS
jgi:hypothetical protein